MIRSLRSAGAGASTGIRRASTDGLKVERQWKVVLETPDEATAKVISVILNAAEQAERLTRGDPAA